MAKASVLRFTVIRPIDYRQATRELNAWGRYVRRSVCQVSRLKCTLAEIAEYGMHAPSGYYAETPIYNPMLLQAQRVWAFMPDVQRMVVYVHFVILRDAEDARDKEQFLRMLNTKRIEGECGARINFGRELRCGVEFYAKYRDTDFSAFDDLPKNVSRGTTASSS
jgi:hypothetical protein